MCCSLHDEGRHGFNFFVGLKSGLCGWCAPWVVVVYTAYFARESMGVAVCDAYLHFWLRVRGDERAGAGRGGGQGGGRGFLMPNCQG